MWYYIWYGLAALCAAGYAIKSFHNNKEDRLARLTGYICVAAAAINLLYLARIHAESHLAASLSTSIFLSCLSLLVLLLVHHGVESTRFLDNPSKTRKFLFFLWDAAFVVDILLLMTNVFHEKLLVYQYDEGSSYAIHYGYTEQPLFYAHLCFLYLNVLAIFCGWISKAISVPRLYRSRYYMTPLQVAGIGIVSLSHVTGVLQLPVDVTVLMYGFSTAAIYWSTFDYTSKGMLNFTRKLIVEYMGAPMILFDYEGYVADTNKDMRNLFPMLNSQERRITLMDFIQIASIRELQNTSMDQVFEWYNPADEGDRVYQCTFTCLKDEKDRNIGQLLLMKNVEQERDMLTQLPSKRSFYSRMEHLVKNQMYPITVAVCNANSIGLINDVYGWTKGNEMLRTAADLLRDNLPRSAVTARLEDGDMAAGFAEAEQEYAVRLFEQIGEQYREANDMGIITDLEYGIAVIRDDSKSVEEAVREASESMRTKKLMNESSQKSSQLDSLRQTLTESDYETEEHVERTREMATRLGRALKLSDAELGKLALLAVLHDIGKIAIPHSILLKPGKLTEEEWKVMKTHTEKGYRIASASKELQPIAEYILHHHERWDGKGYPGGLAGEEIPLLSRIITVVDSHDVMVHDRPYHKAMSHEEAVEELLRCSGSQFDPHIVTVFLQVLQEEG
ncbi:MAG: HD domain-containing protein [Clostridiales bacterium]|nr:HD domain-containing protein [Clostridiales bacterium]